MGKNKHLTDEERLQIEHWLKAGVSLNGIAEELGKSRSTISREIRAHAVSSDKSDVGRVPNRCAMHRECIRCQLCLDKPDCTRRCSTCKLCNIFAIRSQLQHQFCNETPDPALVSHERRQNCRVKVYLIFSPFQYGLHFLGFNLHFYTIPFELGY